MMWMVFLMSVFAGVSIFIFREGVATLVASFSMIMAMAILVFAFLKGNGEKVIRGLRLGIGVTFAALCFYPQLPEGVRLLFPLVAVFLIIPDLSLGAERN